MKAEQTLCPFLFSFLLLPPPAWEVLYSSNISESGLGALKWKASLGDHGLLQLIHHICSQTQWLLKIRAGQIIVIFWHMENIIIILPCYPQSLLMNNPWVSPDSCRRAELLLCARHISCPRSRARVEGGSKTRPQVSDEPSKWSQQILQCWSPAPFHLLQPFLLSLNTILSDWELTNGDNNKINFILDQLQDWGYFLHLFTITESAF